MENSKNTNEETTIEKPKHSFINKLKLLFFIFNIFSLTIYTTYTLYSIYNKNKSTVFSTIIIVFLIIYFLAFVFLIINGIKNKKKLKADIKNYKSSIKILKLFIKVLNLSLSIMTAINIFVDSGKLNIFLIIFGILSIFIAVNSIMFEILKIVLRRKKLKKKSI